MSKKTDQELSEASLKRRYVRPTLEVRGRLQTVTGKESISGGTGGVSDIRLKRDVLLLAVLDSGIRLYRYRYLWSDQVYVGVMAQEVQEMRPEAVVCGADGFLRVDYRGLGLKLQTWEEWMNSSRSKVTLAA